MKKILFVAFFAIIAVACNKNKGEEPTPTPEMVTISFEHRIVEGHSMVRSTSNDFLDIIESHTPKVVTVTLKNTDLNKTYTCESTETITIPIGNYELSAKSVAGESVSVSGSAYTKPMIKANKTAILITPTTDKITIPLYYDCYALFAFVDECKNVKYGFTQYNKYYVAYFHTDSKVFLTPYENSMEYVDTTIEFSLTYTADKQYAEFGKYYIIHPDKVSKIEGSFDVIIPEMEAGEM